MKRYVTGRDYESGDVLVGDVSSQHFFLRGSKENRAKIEDLIQAANNWIHQEAEKCSDVTTL